ncbi:type II secretion system protein GspD [Trinickia mobilis]|uniref:type II secretion system protein GspD n=1 Tax=Trinickia mobilis TaxID=2816356 RepID=UPI001A9004F8|nr:hypothetical protein [Trinickia mobilis]
MKKYALAPLIMSLVLSGCASDYRKDATDLQSKAQKELDDAKAEAARQALKVHTGDSPLEFEKLSAAQQEAKQREWLRSKRISYIPRNHVNAFEILKMLRDNGINVTSSLPLDTYTYSGLGVRNVDGETALKVLLATMGLDYEIDDEAQIVTVEPMKSQTWTINIGNRTTSYTSATIDMGSSDGSGNSQSGSLGSTGSLGSSGTNNSSGGLYGATSGQGGNGANGSNSNGSSSNGNTNSITSSDNFWTSLKTELRDRLSILLPAGSAVSSMPDTSAAAGLQGRTAVPGIGPQIAALRPAAIGGSSGGAGGEQPVGGNGLYTPQLVGRYSINPETGAITVQAPRWIMRDVSKYLNDVQAMYNTQITFEGKVVMVTTSDKETQGLDISSFASFAHGRYGAVTSNNILGGTTVSFPTGSKIPTVTTGSTSLASAAGSLFGITSALDGLQIFNAYLQTQENAQTVQKPLVSTTSGTPVEFGRMTTRHYTVYEQNSSAGGVNGNASVATQNILVPYNLGTILRINPRYDVRTGIIRAQVSLVEAQLVGWDSSTQFITFGNNVQQIPQQTPIINRQVNTAEAVLKDGDLILLGGLSEDTSDDTGNGVTKLKDMPGLSAVFGSKNKTGTRTTMYFVLKVSIAKRS